MLEVSSCSRQTTRVLGTSRSVAVFVLYYCSGAHCQHTSGCAGSGDQRQRLETHQEGRGSRCVLTNAAEICVSGPHLWKRGGLVTCVHACAVASGLLFAAAPC
jgi:hypothetical protein